MDTTVPETHPEFSLLECRLDWRKSMANYNFQGGRNSQVSQPVGDIG